ncbi:MAG: CpaF family protein [Acidimicrobiia bacterium]|nr:CpaF family protein [Acidimicrobiia bacterium]
MLLLVRDHKIEEQVSQWAISALFEGVTSTAPTAVIAADALETDQAARSGRPVVLSLRTDEPTVRLEAAAASAAAVIWIAPTAGAGVRSRLRLDAVGRWAIPVTVVSLSDSPPDAKEAAGGGIKVVWVSPVSGPKPQKALKRLGRAHGAAASRPRRLDQLDKETHRLSAAHAAMGRIEDLLADTGVEEYQIRGGEFMLVQKTSGRFERRHSPFTSDDELVETTRHLASFSGGLPQRFDKLDYRLDIRVGDRWRLHAEAFMCQPPTMVLRSNMAGMASLDALQVADPALQAILVESVSGKVRANTVVAAAMGGGKTTLVQALLSHVDENERIDTIEDTPELRLSQYGIHRNTYERLTRDENADGVGRVSMGDHIRDAKRANSAKLVIGETRGEGTLDVLDAMTSGLDGCLVTLHSRPGPGVMAKLTAYACLEGADPRYARQQIAMAVHLLLWMGRNDRGERVIADVTQITGYDEPSDTVSTLPLWTLGPGQRWAQPVNEPEGLVADVYRSAQAAAGPGPREKAG